MSIEKIRVINRYAANEMDTTGLSLLQIIDKLNELVEVVNRLDKEQK